LLSGATAVLTNVPVTDVVELVEVFFLLLESSFGSIDDTCDTIKDARGVLDGNWGELSAQLSQTTKAVKESAELKILLLFSAFGGIDDTCDTIKDARGVLDGNWGELSAQLSQTTKAVKESTELEVLIRKSGELLLRSSPSPSSTTAGLSSTDNATDTSEDGTNRLDACAEEAAPTEVLKSGCEVFLLLSVGARSIYEVLEVLSSAPSSSAATAGLSSTDNATDTSEDRTDDTKAS